MNINFILNRAKNIIISPVKEWQIIKEENIENDRLITNYAIPFVILSSISILISNINTVGFSKAILNASVSFVLIIVSLYLSAMILNEIAPFFNTKKNINAVYKLVVYSSTPSFIISIIVNLDYKFMLFSLLSLYSVYLYWTGIQPLLETPEKNKVHYIVVSILLMFSIKMILASIVLALVYKIQIQL